MPNFAEQLGDSIRGKFFKAVIQVRKEGLKPDGGCVAMALDCLARGAVPTDIYVANIRNNALGNCHTTDLLFDPQKGLQANLQSASEKFIVEFDYFSSSPNPLDIVGMRVNEALTPRSAIDLVNRLEKDLGVLILKEHRDGPLTIKQKIAKKEPETSGHLEGLISDTGKIIHVDSRRYSNDVARELTPKETARLLRRSQRNKGVIIEIQVKPKGQGVDPDL